MSRKKLVEEFAEKKPSKAWQEFQKQFKEPAARVYFIIAVAALGLLIVTLLTQGPPIASAIILMTGLAGLVLRWTAMPVFTVVLVTWFSFAPFIIPYEAINFPSLNNIPGSYFRINDIIVIGVTFIYLVAQYRLYTIAHSGMPFEAKPAFLKRGAKPTVRQVEKIRDPELIRFFVRIGLFVIIGQLLWLLINNVGLDPRKFPPFVQVDPDQRRYFSARNDTVILPPVIQRILLTTLIFVVLAFLARFVFQIWRWRRMNQDEAAMVLHDTEWSEQRREFNRQEKWRAMAKAKALGQKMFNTAPGCAFYVLAFLLLLLIFMCGGCISYNMTR